MAALSTGTFCPRPSGTDVVIYTSHVSGACRVMYGNELALLLFVDWRSTERASARCDSA